MNDVDYVVKMPGHCKINRLCRVNMLKPISSESENKVVLVVVAATVCLHEQCTEVYPVEGAFKGTKLSILDV